MVMKRNVSKDTSLRNFVILITFIMLLIGLTLPARAGSVVPDATGDVLITGAPSSLAPGADEDNLDAILFIEQAGFVLNSAVVTEANLPGIYTSKTGLTGGILAAGTLVSSYYLHADPIASTGTPFSGSITFGSEILGVEATSTGLNATDSIFGDSNVVYAESDNARGFELTPNQDQFSISPDGLTLSFAALTWNNVDDLRIITAEPGILNSGLSQPPTPEPGTFFLLGLALVGLGWFRKGRNKSRIGQR
jgi:hypothetical protein